MKNGITPRENMLLSFKHECPERIPNFRTDVCGRLPEEVLERAPGGPQGGTGLDWFGVRWRQVEGIPGSMVDTSLPPLLDLENITNWDMILKFPDLDKIDWKRAAERDKHMYDENKVRYMSIFNGPYERLHALMGMENANMAILEEPEATYALLEAITNYKIDLIDRLTNYFPLDLVNMHDDWGHNRSSFLSPPVWRKMIQPHIKRISDFVHSKNLFFDIHSCGYVENIIPDMIDAGIDGWSSVQCINDVRAIICKYGDRLCLTGGMDPNYIRVPGLTEKQVHDMAANIIDDLCRGGALLPFGNSNANIPYLLEQINVCLDERKDFFNNPENRKLPVLE